MAVIGDTWYRYVDRLCSRGTDECGDDLPGSIVQVDIHELTVLKITPKGIWLTFGPVHEGVPLNNYMWRRFQLESSTRKFACPTKELALESFIERKKCQASIYENRAKIARIAIRMASKAEPYWMAELNSELT